MRHPGFTTLFAIASGASPRRLREEIRAHLSACAVCAVEMAAAERLLETVRADRLTEPPEAVIEAALALWKTERRGERTRAARAGLRRTLSVVKALLAFDSFASPAAAGVRTSERSPKTTRARKLVYRAGDYDIELTLLRPRTPKERPSMRGQLLSRRAGEGVPERIGARLGRTGGRPTPLALDPYGAFSTGPLSRGRYRLAFDVGRSRLVVERIEIR